MLFLLRQLSTLFVKFLRYLLFFYNVWWSYLEYLCDWVTDLINCLLCFLDLGITDTYTVVIIYSHCDLIIINGKLQNLDTLVIVFS